MPPEAMGLWRAWRDLSRARRSGFAGPEPIGWADIEAYARLRGEPLEPWEAAALRDLDDEHLAAVDELFGGGKGEKEGDEQT